MSISKIKAHILILGIAVLLSLSACGLLVYYVDPFFHYHAPIDGFAYIVDNQLTQNPGMAEHMDYDSVILGSSMTVNFETDWFKELMDLKTLKLSYSSAYPKDISNILSKVYGGSNGLSRRNIKAVFLGLDIVTYSGGIDETKYPLPEYLYNSNPIDDIRYLINKDVLLNYVIRPMIDPEPTNLSHVYASWWTDDYYNEEWVLRNHDAILAMNELKLPADAFVEPIRANMDVNIIPYIKAHPESEFVIFFPPYSILFWNDVLMDNRYEATLNAYRCVYESLKEYENVRMFFFPAMKDTVTDLNNYADYTHYHPSVNRYMTECFVNGEYEINSDKDIDYYLNQIDVMISEYDFNELRNKLEEYHGQ